MSNFNLNPLDLHKHFIQSYQNLIFVVRISDYNPHIRILRDKSGPNWHSIPPRRGCQLTGRRFYVSNSLLTSQFDDPPA